LFNKNRYIRKRQTIPNIGGAMSLRRRRNNLVIFTHIVLNTNIDTNSDMIFLTYKMFSWNI